MKNHLRHILEQGVLKGKFRQDLDIEAQTHLIFRMTDGVHSVMTNPKYDVERITKAIMGMVMNRLTA